MNVWSAGIENMRDLLSCLTCQGKIKKRATYLFEAEQNGYLCKKCWLDKYDKKLTEVE